MDVDPRRALAQRVYYGWVITAACFLVSGVVFGTTYAFGVFYDVFIETFDSSESLVAVVFGVQTALLYLSGIAAGRVIDWRGRRSVASGASVVLVAGLVWTAFARSYVELLAAFGVVTAVGLGGLYVVGYATVPAWFERRRGTATSLASAGLGIGLIVVPPGANAVITAFDWRVAILTLAGFVALLCVLVVVLLADDPDDVGADTAVEFDSATRTDGDDESADIRGIVTSAPFVVVFVGWTLVFSPMFVVFSHVVKHATVVGVGRSVGVLAIAVIGAATTTTRIGIGPISDRLGRPETFIASSAILGGSTAALAGIESPVLFLATVAVFGVGYAGCGGLIGAVTADLFGNEGLDTLFGVLSNGFALAGLTAPPLAGLYFERTGDYRLVLVVYGAVGLLGAGCVALGTRMVDTSGTHP